MKWYETILEAEVICGDKEYLYVIVCLNFIIFLTVYNF